MEHIQNGNFVNCRINGQVEEKLSDVQKLFRHYL